MLPALFVPVPTCALHISTSSAQGQTTARRPRKLAPPDARAVSTLSVGEILVAKVNNIGGADSAWLDINCATLTGKSIHARLRLLSKCRKGPRKVPPPGSSLPVRVFKLNVPAARVEVVPAWETPRAPPPSPLYKLEDLSVGQKLTGVVLGVVPAGAVVEVRVSRAGRRGHRNQCTGLLRRIHFAPGWASAADLAVPDTTERVISPMDNVDLYVRDANVQCGSLFLNATPITAEQVQQERRLRLRGLARRYRRKGVDSLAVGERRTGTVCSVQKYGCFVDVGVKTDGLVHFSDMGERYSRTWKTSVPKGARVVVEVVEVKEQRFNLRLIGLLGEIVEDDGEIANVATARPSPPVLMGNTAGNEGLDQIDDEGDEATEGIKMFGENNDTDKGLRDGSLDDKFTDEYLEDKYGY